LDNVKGSSVPIRALKTSSSWTTPKSFKKVHSVSINWKSLSGEAIVESKARSAVAKLARSAAERDATSTNKTGQARKSEILNFNFKLEKTIKVDITRPVPDLVARSDCSAFKHRDGRNSSLEVNCRSIEVVISDHALMTIMHDASGLQAGVSIGLKKENIS